VIVLHHASKQQVYSIAYLLHKLRKFAADGCHWIRGMLADLDAEILQPSDEMRG